MPRFVLVSDIHCAEVQTPPGDVLILAGDATVGGTFEEFRWLEEWFQRQPQSRKFYIPGNHDWGAFVDRNVYRQDVVRTPTWLVDEEIHTVGNVRIYGSPWTPKITGAGKWGFPLYGGSHSEEKWAEIPEALDILVTHGPPYGISDTHWVTGAALGDRYLRWQLEGMVKKPPVHVFGHIHSAQKITYARDVNDGERLGSTLFLNASVCDEKYRPTNDIVLLDYEPGQEPVVTLVRP